MEDKIFRLIPVCHKQYINRLGSTNNSIIKKIIMIITIIIIIIIVIIIK